MKIILIGPVYPYKGGISHYTGLMCRALRNVYETVMISYKLQYPKFMYKKEQKDYSNSDFEIPDTRYLINTANPLNWIKSAVEIRKMKANIIMIQWWHPYFAPCYYVLTKLLRKHKILFICHNVFPHERFPFDRFLTKAVLKQGDYFVVQSHLDEKDLLGIKKNPKYVVTPHPTYNAFKMQNLSRLCARELLDIQEETPVLLFFGFVREYKGLKYLLQAMPEIKKAIPDVQLWVVGDFGSDKEEYLKLIADEKIENQVIVVEGYVEDREVEKYFAASDLIVLPYISATQSGIVQIAYGFEKPVVVTNVGGLPDVVDDGETGYVVEAGNPHALAEAIGDFFQSGIHKDWQGNIRRKADEFSWDTMVGRVSKLVEND